MVRSRVISRPLIAICMTCLLLLAGVTASADDLNVAAVLEQYEVPQYRSAQEHVQSDIQYSASTPEEYTLHIREALTDGVMAYVLYEVDAASEDIFLLSDLESSGDPLIVGTDLMTGKDRLNRDYTHIFFPTPIIESAAKTSFPHPESVHAWHPAPNKLMVVHAFYVNEHDGGPLVGKFEGGNVSFDLLFDELPKDVRTIDTPIKSEHFTVDDVTVTFTPISTYFEIAYTMNPDDPNLEFSTFEVLDDDGTSRPSGMGTASAPTADGEVEWFLIEAPFEELPDAITLSVFNYSTKERIGTIDIAIK